MVVAGTVMAILGALQTGATQDESYHVARLDNFLDHGVYALDTAVAGTDVTGAAENTVVYAPVTSLLLHLGSVLTGQETWGSVATTPAAYDSRHVGVVLIGLMGTAAAAGIVRILLRSWRWGLVGAASLLALPMWTGHLMFNIKDVPVASGYTVMTLALVAMVDGGRRHRLLRIAGLFAGVVLMVGTRPAMLSAVLVGVLVLLAGLLLAGRTAALRGACLEIAVAGATAFTVLLLIYPPVFAHPGSLMDSAQKSSSFMNGARASLGYVPFHLATQTPLLLLALFAIGVVATVRWLWVGRLRDPSGVQVLLVATQLFALPLVAVVSRSDLYNGLRQLLFFAPAWSVLVALGLSTVVGRSDHSRSRIAVGIVAAIALLTPVVDQALLFPYQYTYYNIGYDLVVGDRRPYNSQTDYWRASTPELLDEIPPRGQVICLPVRRPGPDGRMIARRQTIAPSRSVDCRVDPLGPLASIWKARRLPLDSTLQQQQFYAVINNDYPVPANCTRMGSVTRPRHGRTITMLYVARCTSGEPPRLGERPIRFAPTATSAPTSGFWAYLPTGWVNHSATGGVDAFGPTSVVAFTTRECADRGCVLALTAAEAGDVSVSVNGTAVPVRRSPGHLHVTLPAGTTDAWVAFSGAPLRLKGIALAPVAP